jgi:disulfide oxidoreductase YuzD
LGPGLTIATTGNVLEAGLQYGANSVIEKETGKNTFEHLQNAVDNQNKNKKFHEKFTNLVEKKFELTREKLNLN